jgi:hypothetical protein
VDLLHTVIQDPFAIILEIPQIYLRSLHFWSRWHCGVERRENRDEIFKPAIEACPLTYQSGCTGENRERHI